MTADSDEVEDLSEFKLVATLEPFVGLCHYAGFRTVTDKVNHQIDCLFVHEHAARALRWVKASRCEVAVC